MKSAIEVKEEIEWEDIVEAYNKMTRSRTKVGEAHVSCLELADAKEERANAAWIEKVQ